MKSGWGRRGARQPKQLGGGLRGTAGRLSVVMFVLLICTISLFSRNWPSSRIQLNGVAPVEDKIRESRLRWFGHINTDAGWRPSSAPRSYWPSPPTESNGYLRVRCNGGLNQQRIVATTQWRKVQDRLKDDERCSRLEKIYRPEIFQEYIQDLEKEEEEQKTIHMEGDIAAGILTAKTHWRDYCIKVKDSSSLSPAW